MFIHPQSMQTFFVGLEILDTCPTLPAFVLILNPLTILFSCKTSLLCGNALLLAVAFDSEKSETCLLLVLLHNNECQLHFTSIDHSHVWFGICIGSEHYPNACVGVFAFSDDPHLV